MVLPKQGTTFPLKLSFRRGPQGQQGDFGRTVQAHGNTDGAQAGAGVERERTYLVRAPNILFRQFRQIKRGEERKSDLAAVRVS